eukprot:m.13507 g.13507  ORF g.13507 m.13507 type:complete len:333 (+) comp24947_c0_seq2:1098-2096(+)
MMESPEESLEESSLLRSSDQSQEQRTVGKKYKKALIGIGIGIGILFFVVGAIVVSQTLPSGSGLYEITVGPQTTTFRSVGSLYENATITLPSTDLVNHTRLYACSQRPSLVGRLIDETLDGHAELGSRTWISYFLFLNEGSVVGVSFCAPRGVTVLLYSTSEDLENWPFVDSKSDLLSNTTVEPSNCTSDWTPNGHIAIKATEDGPYQLMLFNGYNGPIYNPKYVYNLTFKGETKQYNVTECSPSCSPKPPSGSLYYPSCSVSLPPSASVVLEVDQVPDVLLTHKIPGTFRLSLSELRDHFVTVRKSLIATCSCLSVVGAGILVYIYKRKHC